MELQVEYASVSHISDDPQYVEPDFSELIGESAEFYMSNTGWLTDCQGFDDLPIVRSPTIGTINEEKYLIHLQIQFPILPENKVGIGDTWKAKRYFEEREDNALFKVNANYIYKLVEETELNGVSCVKIIDNYSIDVDGTGNMQGMPFEADIQGNGSDTLYFDFNNGMLIKSDGTSTIEGSFEFKEDELSMPMFQTFKEGVKVTVLKL